MVTADDVDQAEVVELRRRAKEKAVADVPVIDPQLLDDVRATLTRYVVFPSAEAADATALWVAVTHALAAFQCAPRLNITSPKRRCGKTRLMELLKIMSRRGIATVNISEAALFRLLGADESAPPTLLVDEADTIFGNAKVAEQHEGLRAILNAGHSPGWPVYRCVGPQQRPEEFNVFSMAAIAGIGKLPDTIVDRGVNITLQRRAQDEPVHPYRIREDQPKLVQIRERLAKWAAAAEVDLAAQRPTMPVTDRAADTWEPLLAVAEVLGGGSDWPKRAVRACRKLVGQAEKEDQDTDLELHLLIDIRKVWPAGVPSMRGIDLINKLKELDDAPWSDWEFTTRRLSDMLRPYKVRSHSNGKVREYRRADLESVFERYIPSEPVNSSETEGRPGRTPYWRFGELTVSTRQSPPTDGSKASVVQTVNDPNRQAGAAFLTL